jgi:hypothetical protein
MEARTTKIRRSGVIMGAWLTALVLSEGPEPSLAARAAGPHRRGGMFPLGLIRAYKSGLS